jgi:Mn-dependent DtxR family transcriptional regulator
MLQTTSLFAYQDMRLSGELSRKQRIIYQFLKNTYDPPTNLEIARTINWDPGSVSGRMNELKKKGLVEECEKRYCRVSTEPKKVLTWKIKAL